MNNTDEQTLAKIEQHLAKIERNTSVAAIVLCGLAPIFFIGLIILR